MEHSLTGTRSTVTMRWCPRIATCRGASLVEIAITALVIAVTALIIAAFSRNTLFMAKDARSVDAAHLAGEQKILELSKETFPAQTGVDTAWVDSIRCVRNWSVKDTGYITRAIVTVQWNTNKGDKQITLTGALD